MLGKSTKRRNVVQATLSIVVFVICVCLVQHSLNKSINAKLQIASILNLADVHRNTVDEDLQCSKCHGVVIIEYKGEVVYNAQLEDKKLTVIDDNGDAISDGMSNDKMKSGEEILEAMSHIDNSNVRTISAIFFVFLGLVLEGCIYVLYKAYRN